ncbi:hypothetical protein L3Q82_007965 [Scortum barcoo]|uniref:Uncharacterized protein n=1 Tax=Scortum barcoo TaxID=214431 RepID=A0ACB8WKQ2_9TELE|nr:hypothetical protein L3Q82_007965 [Scortum barcoo]
MTHMKRRMKGRPNSRSISLMHGLITSDDETAYQRGGRSPDILVTGQQPPSQHQQNKGADRGLQEEARERNTPPSPSTGLQWRESAVHTSKDLTWTHHTLTSSQSQPDSGSSSSAGCGGSTWTQGFSAYRCTIESILIGCITAWYSSCTALNRKALQREVKAAQHITRRTELPSMEDLYTQRCRKKATKIIKDPSHPATDCSKGEDEAARKRVGGAGEEKLRGEEEAVEGAAREAPRSSYRACELGIADRGSHSERPSGSRLRRGGADPTWPTSKPQQTQPGAREFRKKREKTSEGERDNEPKPKPAEISKGSGSFAVQQITGVKCGIVLGPNAHSPPSERDAEKQT